MSSEATIPLLRDFNVFKEDGTIQFGDLYKDNCKPTRTFSAGKGAEPSSRSIVSDQTSSGLFETLMETIDSQSMDVQELQELHLRITEAHSLNKRNSEND